MTKTLARVATAVMGAVVLSLGFAGGASAAPGDVTASASVSGSTVSVTINNNLPAEIGCEIEGWRDPNMPPIGTGGPFGEFNTGGSLVIQPNTPRTFTFPNIADGNFHIFYYCSNITTLEFVGGTSPRVTAGMATGQPIPVTVPNNMPPCMGSSCMFGS
jgi:hypothetical protein